MTLPEVTSVSHKVAGDKDGSMTVSANNAGVVGVKVTLGAVWGQVQTNLGAIGDFLKILWAQTGSFVVK